jgi:pimeloyl-ACP methyl ester carboxylesterase
LHPGSPMVFSPKHEIPMSSHRSSFLAAVAFGLLSQASPARAADGPESKTFDAKGVKIHYLLMGEGEPVVLIHGLYSSAEINWGLNGVIRELAKDHQVIALDMPGHGRSDKPEKEEAYGIQVVEDVVLLLDELKIKKAHIVGYSLGGMVAVKMMAKHPDRVLSGTVGGMRWFKEGSPLQEFWDKLPARDVGKTPAAFLKTVGQLAVGEDELKKIDLPVKVIVGDRDPVKKLYVTSLQEARKDWPVVEIEGAGHLNCIMKKRFKDEIAEWVRKNTKEESCGVDGALANPAESS